MGAICPTTDLCLNLSFMPKVAERVVTEQLNEYLLTNDLMPRYQSAYRKKHSTETALLRVWSDMLNAADTRQVTLLGLLDLSAAFGCVDHDLLLQRLEHGFGLADVVLRWIHSFLSDRTMEANCLQLDHCCSAFHKAPFWGHCCTFCTLPNSNMWSCGLNQYADDFTLPSCDSQQHCSGNAVFCCECQ